MIRKLFREDKKKFYKELSFVLLSLLIPFAVLLILCTVNGFALFSYDGNTMMLYDTKSQYIAYMNDFRNILKGNLSFVYTTEKALGGDYMSIYSYYLASPFNFFIVFFEENATPLFFIWTSIIKMCFASFNFYLLIRLTSKFGYHKLVAAIGYGLISYSFVYMTNFMWLDGVMILPLCILGLYYLKDRKHLWLYPLALCYALLTSWYIGFMVCIFIFLFFLCLFGIDFRLKNKANYLFILRFAVFSVIGGLLAAPLWASAFLHLSGTKGSVSFPPNSFVSINVLISGFLENNYDETRMITQYNSYFTMFIGVVPLVFMITYFFNGKISWKNRTAFGLLFLVYLVFSFNNVLTTLMHGGREPTWFPGRYSFIMGFIVCFLASKSMDEADKLHPLYYLAPTLIGVIAIILLKTVITSERLPYYEISIPSVILYYLTIVMGALYSYVSYYDLKFKAYAYIKKYSFVILASLTIIQVASLYRGGDKVMSENVKSSQLQKYSTYLEDTAYFPSFNAIKKYDKDTYNSAFYRMEATFNRPGNYNYINNNPMFYSYSGLSHFSSSQKKEVDKFLNTLGFHYNGYFTKYETASTYAINSLLGIKYLVEDKTATHNTHPYFLDYQTFSKIDVEDPKNLDYYYNPYFINLGFISDKTSAYYIGEGVRISDSYTYWFDKFEFINNLFKHIDNSINEDIYKKLTITSIDTTVRYNTDIKGIRTYYGIQKNDRIKIHFEIDDIAKEFPLYVSEKQYFNDCNYYLDGKKIEFTTYWKKGIKSFAYNNKQAHTLDIVFNKTINRVTLRPELYYEDLNVAKLYLSKMKESELKVTSINDGNNWFKAQSDKMTYNASINIKEKANKDLIITLPYEKNIAVFIDNKEAETYLKDNIFTAVDISSLEAGEHTVRVVYLDKGLRVGRIGLLVGVLFGTIGVIAYNRIENKIFYRKKKEIEETV